MESAVFPPDSAPLLPDEVGACSRCVFVGGLVPGCETRLTLGSNLIGSGTADINGSACVALDTGTTMKGRLEALMVVCGATGPSSSAPIVDESQLPKPAIIGPLFGCQTTVALTNLRKGAMVNLETDTGTDLGSFCSCWTSVSLDTGSTLEVGTQVRARQYWDGPCEATGEWSDWVHVVQPDDRIKPEILQPLVEGDDVIRVTNQLSGATLLIRIRADGKASAKEFGPRPASSEVEIGLNYPLAAGNVVSVVQTLCGVAVESDEVIVLARPSKILPPVIVPPLYEGGTAIQVSNLYPGALVRVYMDGSLRVGMGRLQQQHQRRGGPLDGRETPRDRQAVDWRNEEPVVSASCRRPTCASSKTCKDTGSGSPRRWRGVAERRGPGRTRQHILTGRSAVRDGCGRTDSEDIHPSHTGSHPCSRSPRRPDGAGPRCDADPGRVFAGTVPCGWTGVPGHTLIGLSPTPPTAVRSRHAWRDSSTFQRRSTGSSTLARRTCRSSSSPTAIGSRTCRATLGTSTSPFISPDGGSSSSASTWTT